VRQQTAISPANDRSEAEGLSTLGNRPGPVIKAVSTHPQDFYVCGHWEFMGAVNHRFALSTPALVSAISKKSLSNVNSPILACRVLTATGSWADSLPSKEGSRSFQDQGLPLGDLIWVYIKPLGQCCHRLFAFDRRQGLFRVEGWCVFSTRPSVHGTRLSKLVSSCQLSRRVSTYPVVQILGAISLPYLLPGILTAGANGE